MFEKFREVEKNLDDEHAYFKAEPVKDDGFKSIKPSTDITLDEAKKFVEDLF